MRRMGFYLWVDEELAWAQGTAVQIAPAPTNGIWQMRAFHLARRNAL
jgi:hypothetical protein